MSDLSKLEWILWKQLNTVKQISDMAKNPDNITYIGQVPEGITPQDLINLYKERYSILDLLKTYSMDQVMYIIDNTYQQLSNECKTHSLCKVCFSPKTIIDLVKEYKELCH